MSRSVAGFAVISPGVRVVVSVAAMALTAVVWAGPAHAGPAGDEGAPVPASCSTTAAAPSVSASPAAGYDDAFDSYGDSSGMWSGADSTYSTELAGDRELWSFSDTLIGPVNPDGSRPTTTPFVNNSFVVTGRDGMRTVIGGTPANPLANAVPADQDAWYWSGDPTTSGPYLEVPYLEFHRTGSGVFDFAWQANALGRFDARTLRLIDITPLPSASGVNWGSYTLQDGGFTYIYGVEDLGADKYMHVARVRGTDLRSPWQFWTGSSWSNDETDSIRVLHGVSNEYSVSRLGRGYVLITQDTTEILSPHIVAYFSCSPVGPFVEKTAVYTTPETGASGSYRNSNVYTYNAHAHPELTTGNQLLISYNVNSFDINDVFDDVSVYRPRFVVATFSGLGLPADGSVDPIK